MERRAQRARADAEKVAEGLGRSVHACMHAREHVLSVRSFTLNAYISNGRM